MFVGEHSSVQASRHHQSMVIVAVQHEVALSRPYILTRRKEEEVTTTTACDIQYNPHAPIVLYTETVLWRRRLALPFLHLTLSGPAQYAILSNSIGSHFLVFLLVAFWVRASGRRFTAPLS